MKKQDKTIPKKKRGRPATGMGTPVMLRLQPDDLQALDVWRHHQGDNPTRPEAVRRLLAIVLGNDGRNAPSQRPERLQRETALDEALDESFPASDPVEIGHSEHAGQPKKRKAKRWV